MSLRRGTGRVRHLEIKQLHIQSLVAANRLKVNKIDGDKNKSDIGTKVLTKEVLDKHMVALGYEWEEPATLRETRKTKSTAKASQLALVSAITTLVQMAKGEFAMVEKEDDNDGVVVRSDYAKLKYAGNMIVAKVGEWQEEVWFWKLILTVLTILFFYAVCTGHVSIYGKKQTNVIEVKANTSENETHRTRRQRVQYKNKMTQSQTTYTALRGNQKPEFKWIERQMMDGVWSD